MKGVTESLPQVDLWLPVFSGQAESQTCDVGSWPKPEVPTDYEIVCC